MVAETHKAQLKERARNALKQFAFSAGRLKHCTIENFDPDRVLYLDERQQTPPIDVQRTTLMLAYQAVQHYIAEPRGWLYLYGLAGAGKSHLAAAVCNALAARGYVTVYESVPDLLDFIRRGFRNNTAEERYDALFATDLLFLDDLGIENRTDWTEETLFRLIDGRSKRDALTLITSNLSIDALTYAEQRISSRIAEMAVEVWMPISDYRRIPA